MEREALNSWTASRYCPICIPKRFFSRNLAEKFRHKEMARKNVIYFAVLLSALMQVVPAAIGADQEVEDPSGLPLWLLWAQADSDLDGVKNLDDAFPNNPRETKDFDGDGVGGTRKVERG